MLNKIFIYNFIGLTCHQ